MASGENRQVQVKSKWESFFFPWCYISLGVGWTRRFLIMANQLPKLLRASTGSTPQPIPSFPRLDWQSSLVQHLSQCHFDVYGTLRAFPKWSGGGTFFPLYNYLASFSHAQCTNLPFPPAWLMGRLPGTWTDWLFCGNIDRVKCHRKNDNSEIWKEVVLLQGNCEGLLETLLLKRWVESRKTF